MPSVRPISNVLTAISADGTPIAYERIGNDTGPVIVIVDGALCHRGFGPARAVARRLQADFTVVIYDRRGRGASGDAATYAPELEYEDLAAVIADAGGSAGILGFSSGGAVALQAAAYGVAMDRIAIYEAPYVGIHERAGRPLDYVRDLAERLDRGDRDAAVRYFMVNIVGQPAFSTVIMRLIPGLWGKLRAVAPSLAYDSRVMGSYRVPAALASIAGDVLVMRGGKADADMIAAAEAIAAIVPGAQLRVLPGQTHQVKDTAIAPVLREYFGGAPNSGT